MSAGSVLRRTRVAAAVLAVAAFVALQLPWSPIRTVVVTGPSMQPTMDGGDIAVTVRRATYRAGDVVAFRIAAGDPGAGKLVIHRIVGGDGTNGYVMRGDNREGVDPWRPRRGDVVGEAALLVPRLGLLPALLRTPLGLATFAALVTITAIGFRRRNEQAEATRAID